MTYSNTKFALKATMALGLFTVFMIVASTIVDAQQVSSTTNKTTHSQSCFNPVISVEVRFQFQFLSISIYFHISQMI